MVRKGPWYKITFDPLMAGHAMVLLRAGSKRRKPAAGQWVVFDRERVPKSQYTYQHGDGSLVFSSKDIDACHAWIDAQREPVSHGAAPHA